MNKLDTSNKGSGALGGAIGAVIGLAGGPLGAIGGAVIGSVAADVFKDMAARAFSAREKIRFDNATAYVADGIQENVDAGLVVRQDDFFRGEDNFSSDAAQLLEGVLLKCKAQYQEKKVQLIANIFKNVAYDARISPQTAYQVLSLADGYTYHVLCLLAYYGRKEEFQKLDVLNESFHQYPAATFDDDTWAMAQDIFILDTSGLIEKPQGNAYGNKLVTVPSEPVLTSRGRTIFNLLELHRILHQDVEDALFPLVIKPSWREAGPTYRRS